MLHIKHTLGQIAAKLHTLAGYKRELRRVNTVSIPGTHIAEKRNLIDNIHQLEIQLDIEGVHRD